MLTHQAICHVDDEKHTNTLTSDTNDNIFPGSTRIPTPEHHPQPEQHQQGHGCSLTSTCTTMPVLAMPMLQIYSDRSPVMPELVFTNSDTQSANGDVRWGGGLCGGDHGGVVPVCGPGTDNGYQQPVSAIDTFFRAFLMSSQHSWASWSLARSSPP